MADFATIEEALDALRAGKNILVIDDPDRENEGDIICAAQFATTEKAEDFPKKRSFLDKIKGFFSDFAV